MIAVLPPAAKIEAKPARESADLKVNGQSIEVKWIGTGHLADVRAALKGSHNSNVVFVGRRLSPGARKELSEAGISWVDETGASEMSIGTILISRTGMPEEKSHDLKHWTPAVIAVAEALLCGTKGTQAAMERATGLSGGSCANALRFLTDEKFLSAAAKRGPASARRIADGRRLLDAYAEEANAQQTDIALSIGVTWQDIVKGLTELGRRFDSESLVYAVTGGAAAAVLAPYLTVVSQATVYVNANSAAELNSIAERVNLRPIDGGRLTLKPFPSRAVQRMATEVSSGMRVAPWPRVYADLLGEGVRGEDAAEHLYGLVNG